MKIRHYGKADHLLADAGFSVMVIKGEDYPDEILLVVGSADYDMNRVYYKKFQDGI